MGGNRQQDQTVILRFRKPFDAWILELLYWFTVEPAFDSGITRQVEHFLNEILNNYELTVATITTSINGKRRE